MGRSSFYNPSAKGMKEVREWVKKGLGDAPVPLLTGPLLVVAHHLLPAPKTLSRPKRELRNFLPHAELPDADNLEKFLNDALTGLIWDDDRRIVWMLRSKHYTADKEGRTLLYVKELPLGQPNFKEILETLQEQIDYIKEDIDAAI